jgi:mono/diheme cytochrome c family protein
MFVRFLIPAIVCGLALAWSPAAASAFDGPDDPASVEYFETHVRPLLAQNCIECHGPDKQQGGVRLDQREFVMSEETSIVEAGSPDESRIIQVIRYDDADVQMPPPGKLAEEQIAILTNWISAGAPWPEEAASAVISAADFPRQEDGEIDFEAVASSHWAYQPIAAPVVPEVEGEQAASVVNDVDRFVVTTLAANGLTPSAEADRPTLIRRATMDLWGIPPTYEEVGEFVNDPGDDAYARLIDRLLASPRYGQRWGRHWLDVARYADTKGYVFEENRYYPFSYTYRDYVIDAFNADKPFDRFLLEQIAADQLDLAENDPAFAAMGFLTVGRRALNNQHDIIDDRIDLVTRGLMGMTMACARCHDHKYDPLPTADYYSLYGVFQSSFEPEIGPLVGEAPDTPEYREYLEELHRREQAVEDFVDRTHRSLLEDSRNRIGDYLVAIVAEADLVPEGIEVVYEGEEPREKLRNLWREHIERDRFEDVFRPWREFAELPQSEFAARSGDVIAKCGEDAEINPRILAALRESPPQSMVDVARVYGGVLHAIDAEWQRRLDAMPDNPPSGLDDDPAAEELRLVMWGEGSPLHLPVEQFRQIRERDHRNEMRELEKQISELNMTSEGAPPRAMVLYDNENPTQPVIFERGAPERAGAQVTRHFPRIVAGSDSPAYEEGSGRLEFARQLVSPDNPLTARVFVNRVWMLHFDQGLVESPGDFGVRTPAPVYQDVLDHLAWKFIHEGWSIKNLHREIMRSATYRQSSAIRDDAAAVDPDNRLLWRMNRRRIDFEAMRDSMLFVSGTLDESLGGKSVDLEEDPFPRRRSVYGLIDRNNFSPLLRTFDFPNPDTCSVERPETTVPQQALFAMNSPFVQQLSREIAQRASEGDVAAPERITRLFEYILSRRPTPEEQRLFEAYACQDSAELEELAQVMLLTNEFWFVD